MKVIGIIGPRSAGKDTAARHIASKYNGKHHAHSEILYQILSMLYLPHTRDNAIKLVALRKYFGQDILVKAVNKRILADEAELQVVTGIRFENEFQNIRRFPDNKIVYIDAPLELRYAWHLKRKEKSDDKHISFDNFVELEQRVTEVHIQKLGAHADYKVINDSDIKTFLEKIDQIMQEILK